MRYLIILLCLLMAGVANANTFGTKLGGPAGGTPPVGGECTSGTPMITQNVAGSSTSTQTFSPGQSFESPETTDLYSIEIVITADTDTGTLSLRVGDNTSLETDYMGEGSVITPAYPGLNQRYEIVLDTPVSVVSGTTYYFSINGSRIYNLARENSDVYAGGGYHYGDANQFNIPNDGGAVDLLFVVNKCAD